MRTPEPRQREIKTPEPKELCEGRISGINDGHNGLYAFVILMEGSKEITQLTEGKTVTISLEETTGFWQGQELPKEDDIVLIGNFKRVSKGWRAYYAKPRQKSMTVDEDQLVESICQDEGELTHPTPSSPATVVNPNKIKKFLNCWWGRLFSNNKPSIVA